MKTKINFIKVALRDYRVGALTPSSKYVVERLIKKLKPDAKFIIEYGAGDGVITRKLLERLPADGILVAVERNKRFAGEVKKISDSRLLVVDSDVAKVISNTEILGMPRVDAVISGIPFSFMKPKMRRYIAKQTYQLLNEGGQFLVYQTSPLMVSYMKDYFKKVKTYFEPRNLPPYFLIIAEK